jgi:hypothetical protein
MDYLQGMDDKHREQEQAYRGREDAARFAADIERARQGTSNATPSGQAAPAPVDLGAARAGYVGATQRFANSATDAAQGFGRSSGAMGLMFDQQADARKNYALYGGNPTNNTLLGPGDTAGVNAEIAIGNAREAAKARGDLYVAQGKVPGEIAVNEAKQRLELQLDPMKNPDSLIYNLEQKKHAQGGLSPDEEAQLRLAKRKMFPQADISYTDAETGQHVVQPQYGDRLGDIYGSPGVPQQQQQPRAPVASPGPAIVQPGNGPNGTPPSTRDGQDARRAAGPLLSSEIPPPTAAPAVIGQQPQRSPQAQPQGMPGEIRYGNPKPAAAGQEWQAKAYQQTLAQITAEPILRRFDGTNVPSALTGALSAMGNQTVAAQYVYNQLKTQDERDFFDNAFLFITGKLRTDSGASINPSEFATMFPTIFPMEGDSPERAQHKAKVRARFIDGNMQGLTPKQVESIGRYMQEDGLDLFGYSAPGALGPKRGSPQGGGGHWTVDPDGNPVFVGG